jgi:hypothetical protein
LIAFYVPQCQKYEEVANKILRNGGLVVDQHECFTYQIKPDGIRTGFYEFYRGNIYSSKWIDGSIERGKCLPPDSYLLTQNIDDKARKLNIAKKKKYTIMEGIKLYELITNQKSIQTNTSTFWAKVQNQGILPERTADSMRNFWKKNTSKTLEEFLIECIHESTDFCLSFREIPNAEFVPRFRQQYEKEFEKLANFSKVNQAASDEEDIAGGRPSISTHQSLSRQSSSSNLRELID